jgi:hypothetical protein
MKTFLFLIVISGITGIVGYNLNLLNTAVKSNSLSEANLPESSFLAEEEVRSKNKPLVLIELFTSEGCSSCPPADKNLIYFNEKQPFPEAEVIALSMHVDYWNRLGWKDPFSSAQFSERQNYYSNIFNLDGVYTPQMVVDGQAQFVGSNFSDAQKAIKTVTKKPKSNIELSVADNQLAVNITNIPQHSGSNVWLAIAENNISVKVKNGENGGRTLQHSAVVRELQIIGEINANDNNFEGKVPFQLNADWKLKDLRLVVFVQDIQTGLIVGVNQIRL